MSYVYIIDIDADMLTIMTWDEVGTPTARGTSLTRALGTESLPLDDFAPVFTLSESLIPGDVLPQVSYRGRLDIDFGMPTPMNEIQEQLLTDFVFTWRFYIDNPLTWNYGSPAFRLLSIAILRLASWDFEVSGAGGDDVQLPLHYTYVPQWKYPKNDQFWFHGFFVSHFPDLTSDSMKRDAVSRVRNYLHETHPRRRGGVRLILISPCHVAFAELNGNQFSVGDNLPLLTSSSAFQCAPGARALLRVLTSNCWKPSQTNREQWQFCSPPEILQSFMDHLSPWDAVAFAQASFVAEEYYYKSVPQLGGIRVRQFRLSIPCCGNRARLEEDGINCAVCYAWYHFQCIGVGLESRPSSKSFVCRRCTEAKAEKDKPSNAFASDHGGINRAAQGQRRTGCQILDGGDARRLELRISEFRDLSGWHNWRLRSTAVPAIKIDGVVLFNGAFSGLAYGLEDGPAVEDGV
ncbi:PHD finger domain-containing protein [Aspergillus undulatus]|uniref:PHD finger domain-containing protein n=1 Tax=Aspergillus undulatus TaxID=1810928 RepID=UPI003CCD2BB4